MDAQVREQLASLREELSRLLEAIEGAGRAERLLCGVTTACQALIGNRDLDQAMELAVRIMGDVTGVDRISVFERRADEAGEEQFRRRVAHTRENVDEAALDALGPLSPSNLRAGEWREELFAGHVVRARAAELSGPVHEVMVRAGVRSLLLAPIVSEQETWGFVGFYDLAREHNWSHGEECVLITLAAALGSAVERSESAHRQREMERCLLRAQRLESLALLAGGIAHDMNNLLTAVRVQRDHSMAATMNKHVDEAVDRLADLAGQLMLYAGDQPSPRIAVSMHTLVQETARLVGPSLAEGVEVDTSAVGEVPAILADPVQLRQVLMNLLINASEATCAPGEIRVALSTADLSVQELARAYHGDGARPGPHVVLEVVDGGAGIDPQAMDRVVDPFFTTKQEGNGLGLATVLGVARAHGGALVIESRVGDGTSVRVYLPATPAPR